MTATTDRPIPRRISPLELQALAADAKPLIEDLAALFGGSERFWAGVIVGAITDEVGPQNPYTGSCDR
jgi:hypothetical protein